MKSKPISLLLAAGAATRFGSLKQLAVLEGQALLTHAIRNARAGGCDRVYVVVGKDADKTKEICRQEGAIPVWNPRWNEGMQSSVQWGVNYILDEPDWEQVFLLPADLPWFKGTHFLDFNVARSKAEQQTSEEVDYQIVTQYPEGVGIPALLTRSFVYGAMGQIRRALDHHPYLVKMSCGKHTKDVDYPEDLIG